VRRRLGTGANDTARFKILSSGTQNPIFLWQHARASIAYAVPSEKVRRFLGIKGATGSPAASLLPRGAQAFDFCDGAID
jgi:hypothetical protein